MSSVGTVYREKSPVPSALSPTPQILGASVLHDALDNHRENRDENDIDNPVFGEENESPYNATIKSEFNIIFNLTKSFITIYHFCI